MKYSIDTKKYIDRMVRFCKTQGVNINLENPTTIQDKLAWLNIYDENPLKTKCADKIKLHEYCKEKLGKDICVPILHVYDKVEDINWDELPEQFVMKCNHGSGMNIIVKNKKELDIEKAKKDLTLWMNDDFSVRNGFEAHYHDIERKIFVEEYKNDGHLTLHDYKFWCFNGEPKIYTINDGNGHGDIMYYRMDDSEWNLYEVPHHDDYVKPSKFDEMISMAKTLCEPFKFVRVDFYEINGEVYLGELTFIPGAAAFKYKKHEDDIEMGKLLKLLKIDVYCLCKNEIKIAKFMIDYWKALGDEVNVYVYDGLSTDGCREEFAKYDWIHVIDFEPDALDDNAHVKLKNECWKHSRERGTDFVMVCDFDETIFSYDKDTLHKELLKMKSENYTILAPLSFNLIPDTFPKYENGKYLHEIAQYGFNDYIWEAKPILFDPSKIDEFNVVHGGHAAHPIGNVKWYSSDNLFLIHAKFLGYDYYEERIRNRVVSDWNLQHGIDGETKKPIERLHNEFKERKDKRFKWDDIKNNLYEYYPIRNDWTKWNSLKIVSKEKSVIVSLTSWAKRIGNVKDVLISLLNQTKKADFIELNLSLLEFPKKEKSLPKDLIKLIKENKTVEINWVENNPGVFKKIIPTLKKFYGQDYYLLSVDDDWIYRNDYIKLMVNYLEQSKSDTFCLANAIVIGNRQIYCSTCFEADFWEKLTQEVIDTRIDDSYIEYYLKCKGKKFYNYRPDNVTDITKPFNPICPNSHNTETGQYSQEDIMKANEVIRKINFNSKIAIYTGIIGFYDTPYDNFEHKEGYDYILFSDRKIDTNSWDNRVVNFENADKLDGIKKSRFIKTHPDLLLNGYDIVVWVDCNTVIDEKIYKYINEVKDALITFKKHPDRDCIYDEIMICSYVKKESYEKCLKIYDKYARDGYPRHYGLYENNIIVSHYNDPRVKALMSKWWDEIYNNSHRDQLSLNYIIWKNGYAPMITVAETNYFPPRPHSRPKVSTSNIGKKGKKKKKES